jgi:hypothetical protein
MDRTLHPRMELHHCPLHLFHWDVSHHVDHFLREQHAGMEHHVHRQSFPGHIGHDRGNYTARVQVYDPVADVTIGWPEHSEP